MTLDCQCCLELIANCTEIVELDRLGRAIKFEIDNGYEWTANADEVQIVRDAWMRTAKRLRREEATT